MKTVPNYQQIMQNLSKIEKQYENCPKISTNYAKLL